MRRLSRFSLRMQTSTKSKAVWFRLISARTALLVTAGWASFGCDSGSFIPPVNPELRGDGGATPVGVTDSTLSPTVSEMAPEPARPIEVILSQHVPDEAEGWKTSAMVQAGLDKAKLKISVLDAGIPKSKQAELIRTALAHRPRVLVVEPSDPADSDLAQAILAAQSQGIPVVLVGRSLAGSKLPPATQDGAAAKSSASHENRPPIVVVEPKFAESAQQLVAAAVRLVKRCELDPKGGAVVVVKTVSDPFMAERVLAINEALKAAGIPTVEEVRFESDLKVGTQLLKDRLAAHPKLVMAFAVDPTSSSAVRDVIAADGLGRIVIAGCYTTEDQVGNVVRVPNFASAAEFTPTRVLRKGVSTAVAIAQGKEMPAAVEFRVKVTDSNADPNALRAHFLTPPKADPAKAKGGK